MFFRKKPKKLDSKVRFQHRQFTTKLGTARTYKRQARSVPELKVDKFFAKIGLRSRWSQIMLGLIIAGFLYLIYVPNFLSLQTIEISGVSESQARDLEMALRDEIANVGFYNPQSNLLFFDEGLVQKALEKVPSINIVTEFKRNIREQSITINAEAKYEKYLVATTDKVYDVYNDGTLRSESGINRRDWDSHENAQMLKVLLHSNVIPENNKMFFHPDLYKQINSLTESFKSLDGQILSHLTFKEPKDKQEEQKLIPVDNELGQSEVEAKTEIEQPEPESKSSEPPQINLPINSSEIYAVFYKNNDKRLTYRVIFDVTRDAKKSVEDLKLLLSQTTPERYAQLSYIDLRLENKAFICLQNTPCAQ